MHRILREKFAELTAELCRESFILTDNQRWPLKFLNYIRNGKSFAATSNSQKSLILLLVFEILNHLLDCRWLVSIRLEFGNKFEGNIF